MCECLFELFYFFFHREILLDNFLIDLLSHVRKQLIFPHQFKQLIEPILLLYIDISQELFQLFRKGPHKVLKLLFNRLPLFLHFKAVILDGIEREEPLRFL